MEDRLPDLPASDRWFVKGADKHLTKLNFRKCDHEFEYAGRGMGGQAVECQKCHVGTFLSGEFYLLEGKICYRDELVL